MLALKKKREAEAKAAAEEAARAKQEPSGGNGAEGKSEKVSLLGIGGKKKNKNGDGKTGKKRSPGEIRIQKGNFCIRVSAVFLFKSPRFRDGPDFPSSWHQPDFDLSCGP